MLSIPMIRDLIKPKAARRQAVGLDSGFFDPGVGAGDASRLLVHLATHLGLAILGLIRINPEGGPATLTAAGGSGRACRMTLRLGENEGPIAALVSAGKLAEGRAKIFICEEAFPCDGSWCDLIPMDSVVAYYFVPLACLPAANQLRGSYVLTAAEPDEEGHGVDALRAMAASALIALHLAHVRPETPGSTESLMVELLSSEGYSLGYLGGGGRIIEPIGSFFDTMNGTDGNVLADRLQGSTASPGGRPGAIEVSSATGIRYQATAIPVPTQDDPDRRLVVLKPAASLHEADIRRERYQILSRFMSSVAHEIKNPLTGIAAGIQYLAKKLQPGMTEDETVEFILAEINRLNRIVDDLYNIARRPKLILMSVDINQVVGKSLLSVSEDIVKKRIAVRQNLGDDIPKFDADPDRLQQVLINILKNAIQASPEHGGITIATTYEGGKIAISITDSGAGIAPEDRNRIFEPFHSTKEGGTGLGLCICQSIIDEHRGRILVESPEDGGARFVVELPLET